MKANLIVPVFVGMALAGPAALAQDDAAADATTDAAADTAVDDVILLTQDEIETLAGPVAPLMQSLVASTEPLDVVNAQQYLVDNVGRDPEELKPGIEATDWDKSVQVLATPLPDVISDMATHVEWTETMGNAMLTQSDDVLAGSRPFSSRRRNQVR